MVRPQRLLRNLERTVIHRLRLGVSTLQAVQRRQIVERITHIRVIGSKGRLPNGQRPLQQRFALRGFPFTDIQSGQVVEGGRKRTYRGMLSAAKGDIRSFAVGAKLIMRNPPVKISAKSF